MIDDRQMLILAPLAFALAWVAFHLLVDEDSIGGEVEDECEMGAGK